MVEDGSNRSCTSDFAEDRNGIADDIENAVQPVAGLAHRIGERNVMARFVHVERGHRVLVDLAERCSLGPSKCREGLRVTPTQRAAIVV